MRALIATLCDFAQIREGLLNIVSAGVTRVTTPVYPGHLGCMVAVMLEVADRIPHEVRARLESEDGKPIGEVKAAFQLSTTDADPGEKVYLPLVFDLREAQIPAPGRYQMVIETESSETVLGFRSLPPVSQGSA